MEHIVIGIEGLVGAGKTAICRELLNQIPNSILLQGGNLYRAIVYSLMQSGVEDRGSRPPCLVLVLRDGTLLCVVIGLEVLQDEVTVCDVGLLSVQK